ncbi:MAG: hypothetical protein KQI35_10835 [Bacteroidetes bacterium]|nr:hypothetical protein [Bacteroidota bacterium]
MKPYLKKFNSLVFVFLCIFCFTGYLSAQDWETLAEIPEGLTYPVVTVLDGKIHVMGGGGASGATGSHYAYDPATDSWETLSAVPYLAQQPAGCTAGGKIHYFGGGYPNSGTPLADHYIYDPDSDTWEEASSLTAPRAIHYGAGICDTAYSMAGQGMTTLFEAYNPVTELWEARANLPDGFFMYSARCVANNKIYRFGGGAYAAPKNFASVYDPVINEWSSLPNFPIAIHGMDGAAVGDSIYLTGGLYDAYVTNEVWIYDIGSQTYSEGPTMPIERYYHSVVSLDGCIYLVGGYHPIFPDSVRVSLMRLCPYGTVGVDETLVSSLEQVHFKVDPGSLSIRFPNVFTEHAASLQIYDLLGRELYDFTVHEPAGRTHTWHAKAEDPQIYLIRLIAGNEQIVKKVFIAP